MINHHRLQRSFIQNLLNSYLSNIMMWLVLLVIIFAILYLYMKRSLSYWENKNVVFEKPLIIFGNFIKSALRKEQLGYTLKRLYDQMDDKLPYFGVYVFHSPYLVLKSKDLIKQVLIKNFSSFINRIEYTNADVDPYSSNIPFALKNDIWKTTRTKLSPIFTSGKMKLMLPLMKEVTNEMEDILSEMEGKEIDIIDLSKRYSVDIISSCAFGINSGSLKDANSEMKTMVARMLDQRGFKRSFATFAWLFCPILVDIFRMPFIEQESSQYLAEVFKQSMKKRKENNIKRHDLIDMLNELKEEEAQNDQFQFDDLFMSAQALTFFNAGAEGGTSLMTLCLYEMAINPDIQNELRKEIRQNIDSDGSLSYENLLGMEYLDLVVKETLRKYPFVQFLRRYAEKDVLIEETGLLVEKGTPVLIPVLAINYDPKYYPNPEKFDPDRFKGDKIKDLQYLFLPFGDGPRKCIGDRFALMTAKLGLAMFLKNFEVTPGEKTEIPLKFNQAAFFLTPTKGVHLKIHKVQ